MNLGTHYLISKVRFRVDSDGVCTDQREECMEQLRRIMIDGAAEGPIKYLFPGPGGGPPTLDMRIKIPIRDLDPPPTPQEIIRYRLTTKGRFV